jgi:hypothetical protein
VLIQPDISCANDTLAPRQLKLTPNWVTLLMGTARVPEE